MSVHKTKVCGICKTSKPLDSFNKMKASKDGKQAKCSICNARYKQEWRKKNPEKQRAAYIKWAKENPVKNIERNKIWQRKNSEKVSINRKKWYARNKESHRANERTWRSNNRDKIRSYYAMRRAKLLNATPSWLSKEQVIEIQGFYKEAKYISEKTGEPHHVDHIVPLQGKEVSGLHVPWNLQILTASKNISKSNKLVI